MEGLPPVATLTLQNQQDSASHHENPRIVKAPPTPRTQAGNQAARTQAADQAARTPAANQPRGTKTVDLTQEDA